LARLKNKIKIKINSQLKLSAVSTIVPARVMLVGIAVRHYKLNLCAGVPLMPLVNCHHEINHVFEYTHDSVAFQ
jgi:hypothetical protein